MKQEEIFVKELSALVRLGKNQGNQLSSDQIKEAFVQSGIAEDKMPFIHEYLQKNQIRIDDILQIAVGVLQILCRLVQIVYQQRIMIIIRFFRLKKTQHSSSRSMGSAKVCGSVVPSILFKV